MIPLDCFSSSHCLSPAVRKEPQALPLTPPVGPCAAEPAAQEDVAARTGIRVIAATNVDLEAAVAERRFRRDLYRRIEVIPLKIPPLRERREDIGPLADAFLASINARRGHDGLRAVRLPPSARRLLHAHPWPGNVGQFENLLRRLVALTEQDVIRPTDVAAVLPPVSLAEAVGRIDVVLRPGWGLREILADVERRVLADAWRKYTTQAEAAKHLRLSSQQAFQRRARSLGVNCRSGKMES